MDKDAQPEEISIKHQEFCKAYLLCLNGTKAYMQVYPNSSNESAQANAARLIGKDRIKAHIQELRGKIEDVVGINKEMVANEHRKIGLSSFSNLLNGWMSQKEYDELPTEVIDCIASVETKEVHSEFGTTEEIKIKLYDKQKSLSELSKLFGYYAPEKMDLSTLGEKLPQVTMFQLPVNGRDDQSGG